jgi:hypothetical protein
MEKITNAYILVRNPKGKRQFESPQHRWEDTTELDLEEVGCEGMNGLKWFR